MQRPTDSFTEIADFFQTGGLTLPTALSPVCKTHRYTHLRLLLPVRLRAVSQVEKRLDNFL